MLPQIDPETARSMLSFLKWLPIINLSLLALVIVALTILAVSFWRRRDFWVEQMAALGRHMKEELPPIIVGEIMTRWDMERVDRRLGELETIVGFLESRQKDEDGEVPPGAL